MNKIFTASVTVSAIMALSVATSCSKWTEPQNADYEEGIKTPDAAYLENLRAYKASEHGVSFVSMEAASEAPYTRNQHIAAMPDSLDYISVVNAENGIYPTIVEEITKVNEMYGTKVLCELNYTKIYNAWVAIEEAKEKDEPAGTEAEYREFVEKHVKAQVEAAEKYPFAGVLVSFYSTTQGFHKAGQEVFFAAVNKWRTANSDKDIIMKGVIINLIDKSILDHCKYIVIPVDEAYSIGMMNSKVRSAFSGIYNKEYKSKVVIEVAVPNEANPQNQSYISDYQPIVAAQYVREADKDKNFGRKGFFVSNVQEDYFINNSYSVVKRAISVMNAPKNAK